MKQYHLVDDSPQILFRKHYTLTLDVATEKGEFQFFCDFLSPSFSTFPEARGYHHPDPSFSRLFLIEEGCAEIAMDSRRHRLEEVGSLSSRPDTLSMRTIIGG